jgi:long-chain acyl-CoA synthetase
MPDIRLTSSIMPSSVPLVELPELRAQQDPSGKCLSANSGALSNAQFADAVSAATAKLAHLGVKRGDIVAVMLPNRAEMIITLFATWRLGAAVTPINPALTAPEASYQIVDSGAKVILVDADTVERTQSSNSLAIFAEDLARGGHDAVETRSHPDPTDLALLIYTSGTTGKPKGVKINHANIAAMCESIIAALELTNNDTSLLVLPLFHANGLIVGTLSPLWAGGSVAIAPRFDAKQFWAIVAAEHPTYFSAVPTMYAMLAALPPEASADTSSLRFVISGAAQMPAGIITDFEERYGVSIVEGYGLSEGTVASTLNPLHGIHKPGTVGLALPGQTVAVVDENGRELPQGERGEVVIGGPTVMSGYWNRATESTAALHGGVLHTGDIGFFDPDGYLVLVDRLKDMIIRGGENIYPKEIENILYSHPAVLEAAVIGKPDPRLGEVVLAYVALKDGALISEAELLGYCKTSLAPYKVPSAIFIEAQLPKNSVGKLIKGPLREKS